MTPSNAPRVAFWSFTPAALAERLQTNLTGLSTAQAVERLAPAGRFRRPARAGTTASAIFLRQLRSPLLWLLLFAAAVSLLTGEFSDALIVLAIVGATVGVGFSREFHAHRALDALAARLQTRATVVRDGTSRSIPREELVAGDVCLLSAGTIVPADALIIEATDLYVSEAVLTGESLPVLKQPGTSPAEAVLSRRANAVFLGSNVRSGTARCLVAAVGAATEFGHIAGRLGARRPETDFDRGTRRFGYLLTVAMLVIVILVFVAHVLSGRPVAETLLFSVALAVGLSPELLPAILSINLARSAQMMARRGVLVRELSAIENLGSMDVLCTDKTGTLTEGVVQVDGAWTPDGQPSREVLELALTNARLSTGLPSPLDEAILSAGVVSGRGLAAEPHAADDAATLAHKRAEIPFDFARKRVSVVVDRPAGDATLIVKGAVQPVLNVCTGLPDNKSIDPAFREELDRRVGTWSGQGIRCVAVATRAIDRRDRYTREDETGLTLEGFVTFLDRPRPGVGITLDHLHRLGVRVKVITGDDHRVARALTMSVGLPESRVVTGAELARTDDFALVALVSAADVFAEVDPTQKERIIAALRRRGHVVGFLGDGVNDAPAMMAADTSLSVDSAVDVAREAADFVLLDRDLDVIRGGIEAGRRTFANTLKYVLTTTSANLGNMVSMAVASLFLPFLPLTASQILLNNLLSDVPAVGISDDAVDPEAVERPLRWDIRFIGHFMVGFGLLSSCFDVLTFVLLLTVFHASVATFRTAWFVESLLTELLVALLVRTRRPCWQSRPGAILLWSTVAVSVVAVAVPFVPGADVFGFVGLPAPLLGLLVAVTAGYGIAVEATKRRFLRIEAAA